MASAQTAPTFKDALHANHALIPGVHLTDAKARNEQTSATHSYGVPYNAFCGGCWVVATA
jgi:hypothetical protein